MSDELKNELMKLTDEVREIRKEVNLERSIREIRHELRSMREMLGGRRPKIRNLRELVERVEGGEIEDLDDLVEKLKDSDEFGPTLTDPQNAYGPKEQVGH